METKFQTSFIPKRPLTSESTVRVHRSVSLFMMLGVLIFIVSIAGAGLAWFLQGQFLSQRTAYQTTLAQNENQFQPQLIDTLSRANTKIDISKELIANHLAVSSIFDIIGALTANNIQFKSFDYTAPVTTLSPTGVTTNGATGAILSMQGVGSNFSAIAFQSDVLGSSVQYGRNVIIKNPVLSNLSLDANGNVEFTFTASINPSDISYTKILNQQLGITAGSSTNTTNQ